MYKRILLAFDGSEEGRRALREGALLARLCGARVFLLSAFNGSAGMTLGDSVYPGPIAQENERLSAILDDGVEKLKALGIQADARLMMGDPMESIRQYAVEVGADLVVLGHRRQSLLERWWSGSANSYLTDQLGCSILIGRLEVNDVAFAQAAGASKTSTFGEVTSLAQQ